MDYLKANELLHNGWRLYWARTAQEWRSNNKGMGEAHQKYTNLLEEYAVNSSQAGNDSSFKNMYLHGYEAGQRKRGQLCSEGLPLETMANNTATSYTNMGLYGYLDGMEGKECKY